MKKKFKLLSKREGRSTKKEELFSGMDRSHAAGWLGFKNNPFRQNHNCKKKKKCLVYGLNAVGISNNDPGMSSSLTGLLPNAPSTAKGGFNSPLSAATALAISKTSG